MSLQTRLRGKRANIRFDSPIANSLFERTKNTKDEQTLVFSLANVRQLVRNEVKTHFDRLAAEIRREFNSVQSEMGKEFQRIVKDAVEARLPTVHGDDGYTPRKGVDYTDGKTPRFGVDFFTPIEVEALKEDLRGEDGETPDVNAIVDSVLARLPNEQEFEDLIQKRLATITIDDVEGLKQALTNLASAASKKGGSPHGGMGNFQHELTNISSATTTVSTTYRIAGQGTALLVAYNGQLLTRETDYTVGSDGKTLTLLFTPQDSTVLLVIYIRT